MHVTVYLSGLPFLVASCSEDVINQDQCRLEFHSRVGDYSGQFVGIGFSKWPNDQHPWHQNNHFNTGRLFGLSDP